MTVAGQLGEELRLVIGALIRRIRVESPDHSLTSPQISVLHRLQESGPATAADLARAELITPQAMAMVVASLESEGYVARRDDASDARRRLVSITRAGQRAHAEGSSARMSWLVQAIERELTADEQQAVMASLALLRRLAER
jgi:DNA-binding MarR family transcriptional regulator